MNLTPGIAKLEKSATGLRLWVLLQDDQEPRVPLPCLSLEHALRYLSENFRNVKIVTEDQFDRQLQQWQDQRLARMAHH